MAYTVCELAKLALVSYDAIPSKVDDWEPMRTFGVHERHGFVGVLFRRESLFVLAYRGTDDWQVDLFDDSAILAGKVHAATFNAPGMMMSYGASFVALGPAIARFPVIAQMLQITAPYAVYTQHNW